jgi:hypothetical protein
MDNAEIQGGRRGAEAFRLPNAAIRRLLVGKNRRENP